MLLWLEALIKLRALIGKQYSFLWLGSQHAVVWTCALWHGCVVVKAVAAWPTVMVSKIHPRQADEALVQWPNCHFSTTGHDIFLKR